VPKRSHDESCRSHSYCFAKQHLLIESGQKIFTENSSYRSNVYVLVIALTVLLYGLCRSFHTPYKSSFLPPPPLRHISRLARKTEQGSLTNPIRVAHPFVFPIQSLADRALSMLARHPELPCIFYTLLDPYSIGAHRMRINTAPRVSTSCNCTCSTKFKSAMFIMPCYTVQR